MAFASLVAITAALQLVTSAVPKTGDTVAVYDIQGAGPAGRNRLAPLVDQLLIALQRRGFQTLGRKDIDVVLRHEKNKDIAACDAVACMADIAQALNSKWLIYGNATMANGRLNVLVSLIDALDSRVSRRTVVAWSDNESELASVAVNAVRWLMGPFGELTIDSDPSGAAVTVDGQDIGETPVQLAEIPFGVSRIVVHKPGFVAAERVVRVSELNQLAKRRVQLPLTSELSLRVHRFGGWAGVSVGTAALGAATVYYAKSRTQQADADQAYDAYRVALTTDEAVKLHEKAAGLDRGARSSRTVALAALSVGCVVGAVGAVLLATATDVGPINVTADVVSNAGAADAVLGVRLAW